MLINASSHRCEFANASLFLIGDGEPTEALVATYVTHEFRPHFHETYAIGVALAGDHLLWHEGRTWQVRPGDLIVIAPRALHTGARGRSGAWTIGMLFPSAQTLAWHVPGHRLTRLLPSAPVISHSSLSRPFIRAFDRLTLGEGRHRNALLPLAGLAVATHASRDRLPPLTHDRRLDDVRASLDDSGEEALSLQALASRAGLHPIYLSKLFRDAYGVTPHAYSLASRVERARNRLRLGDRPTQLAHRLGFADQSHFTRTFRRAVGMAPGAYRRSLFRD